MYYPDSRWTWSFFLIIVTQGIIGLAMEGFVFGTFQLSVKEFPFEGERILQGTTEAKAEAETKTFPTYLALFIFAFLYEILLAWDALRLKNTIQVIGLCIFNLGILAYSIAQYEHVLKVAVDILVLGLRIEETFESKVEGFLIAVPCVIALATVLLLFVAFKLYQEFAWSIYKHISADLRLKRRYLAYQVYITLLKFDLFFFLGFVVQFLVITAFTYNDKREKHISNLELGLTVAAIPVIIILLLFAAYSTRKESLIGMLVTIIFYFAALAYFLFKLTRIYASENELTFNSIRTALTIFAVMTIILLLVTIANACWCTFNFNKGLKDHIYAGKRTKLIDKDDKMEMPALASPQAHRMEID